MNHVPGNKVMSCSTNLTIDGNISSKEDLAKFASCVAFDTAPESVIALRNAFFILRDRYNKLKLENQKLVKMMQKPGETSPNKIKHNTSCNDGSLDLAKGQITSQKMKSSLHVVDTEPLSASTLIAELEQLRERLDRMSREAQSYVDADLKDMMVNVIPKLKEFERQCSSLSEEGRRSMASTHSDGETRVRTSDEVGTTDKETNAVDRQSNTDLVASGDFNSMFLFQGSKDLENDLRELLSYASDQSNSLQNIQNILKQQNEKLNKMKINTHHLKLEHIPESDTSVASSDDWTMIQNVS